MHSAQWAHLSTRWRLPSPLEHSLSMFITRVKLLPHVGPISIDRLWSSERGSRHLVLNRAHWAIRKSRDCMNVFINRLWHRLAAHLCKWTHHTQTRTSIDVRRIKWTGFQKEWFDIIFSVCNPFSKQILIRPCLVISHVRPKTYVLPFRFTSVPKKLAS